ncbi:MAG: response regulator [Oscillospiraceae bacterium]|nr:response regulator [Oscillospiraceae bacterium]
MVSIAVCVQATPEREQLIRWIKQYCQLYGVEHELTAFPLPEDFTDATAYKKFDLVFMAAGGAEGFLAARQLRDEDRNVKIILADDTMDYAVKGVRLHFTDFIHKPVEFKHVVRAMKLAGLGQ